MALSTLVVDLILKAGGFESDMGRASKTAQKRMKEIEKAATAAGKVMGAALVAGASAAAIALKNAIDRADELSKTAQKIGVTTEALSSLSYAASLADVELSALQGGLSRLIKAQSDAATGTERTAEMFRAIGVEFKNTDGTLRNADVVFRDIAERLSQLPDGAEKTAVALELLGRSGANLIPLLNGGAAGLDEMKARAEALGVVIDTETGKAAEEFNDRLTDLGFMVTGLSTAVAAELLPTLNKLTDEFANGIRTGGGFKDVAFEIATGIRFVGDVALAAKDSVVFLVNALLYGANKANELFLRLQALNPLLNLAGAGELADKFGRQAQAAREGMDDAASSAVGRFEFEADLTTPARATAAQAGGGGDAIISRVRDALDAQKESASAAAKAMREKAAADREAAKAAAELLREQADFSTSIDDMVAELGGPLAQAQLEYNRQIEELQDKLDRQVITVDQATEAQALYGEIFKRVTDEIRERESANEQYLSYLQEELDFLKMTNEERLRAVALRGLDKKATDEQKNAAIALVKAIDAEDKAIRAMDDFRSSLEDTFAAIFDGSKSAKEAFNDFAASISAAIARIMAQRLVESLFGQMGTSGGGSSGGFLASFFGALFGGGRAEGGPVDPFKSYVVGENGAEWFVPKTAGTIVPAGAGTVNQTFVVQGAPDRRTREQMARESGRAAARSMMRTGR